MGLRAGNQQWRRRQNVHLRDANGVWHLPFSQLAGGSLQFLRVSNCWPGSGSDLMALSRPLGLLAATGAPEIGAFWTTATG